MNLDLTIGGVECVATQKLGRVTIKARPTSLKRPSPASVIRDALGRNFGIWPSDDDCGTGYVDYICADPEAFMCRLQTTYGVPMSMFLGHRVTHQDVKYDVEKNGLTVKLTVDGDLGKEIQQYVNGPKKSAPDDFRGLTPQSVSFANEQTEIVLVGEYHKFMEAGGANGASTVDYKTADPEEFMDRLSTKCSTEPTTVRKFLGHNITHQEAQYDGNTLNVKLTVDGDLRKEMPQYINGTKKAPDDFRGLTPESTSFANGQTEIVLAGVVPPHEEGGWKRILSAYGLDTERKEIDDMIEALEEGGWKRILSAYRLDTERKEIDDTIEALKRDIQKAKERTMTHTDSTLTSTGDNAKLAAQIAASNVALDKMTTLLQQQLANMGIDTSFMSTPAGRSLVKMALPTMIMTMLDLPPVQQNMPKNARAVVRDVVDNAQLAAMADGMQTLIQLFMPLLAEFAQIKGSLIESSGLSVEDLFSCDEEEVSVG